MAQIASANAPRPIDYDSVHAREFLGDLYDRQGFDPNFEERFWIQSRLLTRSPNARESFQQSMEKTLSNQEQMAIDDPVEAQLQVSHGLQHLNGLSTLDWSAIDPGFGLWLQAKIGQSNQILDKIELEHPELRPTEGNDHTIDLLIRSQDQRNVVLTSMQRNLDQWNVKKHTDPKGTHENLVDAYEKYKWIAEGANWQQIDPEFATRMNRLMENTAGLIREIERTHPELK